jgi:hypothetical protein
MRIENSTRPNPEPRGDDAAGRLGPAESEADAENRYLSARLEAWAERSSSRSNIVAVGMGAFMMIWLMVATRDRPDQASILQGAGLLVFSLHAAIHAWIVLGLKRLRARGIAGAEKALRAYLGRVTHMQLAIGWGLLALIASI